MTYDEYIGGKFAAIPAAGFDDFSAIPDGLFPHQVELVKWAIKRGRAAIFADTGLGKSRMQLAWANAVVKKTGGSVLILAPLAVADQTVSEGVSIGVQVTHAREQSDIRDGVNITNYDRLHKFEVSEFHGVVLDESSIIKHHTSKTLKALLDAFRYTPYKLCATATPAPNDWTELGTHAEFLGVCTRQEMLAEYFTHDGGETSVWRLKGHARDVFWRWVCTWGALVRRPSDIGFDDTAYALEPVHLHEHSIDVDGPTNGQLFASEARTLSERRDARRRSINERAQECADLVNADDEPWVIWCDLNAEADALCALIPDAVEIRGSDDADVKERRLAEFARGDIRVLVTKPKIAGFGLNWQHCARMAFVGVTDSFESYYQAIRRCWRFGQKRAVHVHVFASTAEGAVVANLRRKEAEAIAMAESLSAETHAAVMGEIIGLVRQENAYNAKERIALPAFIGE